MAFLRKVISIAFRIWLIRNVDLVKLSCLVKLVDAFPWYDSRYGYIYIYTHITGILEHEGIFKVVTLCRSTQNPIFVVDPQLINRFLDVLWSNLSLWNDPGNPGAIKESYLRVQVPSLLSILDWTPWNCRDTVVDTIIVLVIMIIIHYYSLLFIIIHHHSFIHSSSIIHHPSSIIIIIIIIITLAPFFTTMVIKPRVVDLGMAGWRSDWTREG